MKLLMKLTSLKVLIYGVKYLDANFLDVYQLLLKAGCFLLKITLITRNSLKINIP